MFCQKNILLIVSTLLVLSWASPAITHWVAPQEAVAAVADDPSQLTIVWTSGDPEVAHRMVLMYCSAAKNFKWFDKVRLIVWGPSARLVAADKEIQAKLKEMQEQGVVLEACVVCANSYGVTEKLKELGLDVKPMGKPLSDSVRDPTMHLLTF